MKYGTVKRVNKPVAHIVLGTMIITDEEEAREKGAWGNLNRAMSFDLLDAVFEMGGNTFDSAHVYGIGGASERGLGAWMQARGNRDEVVILTKGAVRSSPPAPYKVMASFIDTDIYESLARLQTDTIDIYLLHRDAPEYPVGLIVETLHKHFEAGRIHAYGGSNWTYERIIEANAYAADHGLAPFVASEPHYSLAEQVVSPHGPGCVSLSGPANKAARAWYTRTQMPAFNYSSLGGGLLSGRVSRENYEEVAPSILGYGRTGYCHDVNFDRLDRAEILAEEKGVTIPQIALAFILQSGMDTYPLVGARTPEEFADAVAALDVDLTAEERAWLDLERETR
jgi:aryl-alcohol dehydrogenase-like predicted oxidoreductase